MQSFLLRLPPAVAAVRRSTALLSSSSSSSPATLRRRSFSIPTMPIPATSPGGSNSDDGFAAKLWINSRRELHFAMYTPFVVCLASGNLKIESFRHYIAQDFHFLTAFAHAYELAEECADDDDDAKSDIADLRKAVLEELKMHHSFVQVGIILMNGVLTLLKPKEVLANSATVRYTDFLLDTASGKIEGVKGSSKLATPTERRKLAAYTIGAMAPCMRLYAFLGNELQALVDVNYSSHPYKKWIENY
ncbi:Bifunctional TH2 protein, mitochondrial [Linum grandiflorum]